MFGKSVHQRKIYFKFPLNSLKVLREYENIQKHILEKINQQPATPPKPK